MHQLQEEGVWGELLQIYKRVHTPVIVLPLSFTGPFQLKIFLTVSLCGLNVDSECGSKQTVKELQSLLPQRSQSQGNKYTEVFSSGEKKKCKERKQNSICFPW